MRSLQPHRIKESRVSADAYVAVPVRSNMGCLLEDAGEAGDWSEWIEPLERD